MTKHKFLPLETIGSERNKEGRNIPDKLYFRISEVGKLTGLEPYVLRYWESEFKLVKPIRTKSKHRLYKRKDLDLIFEIKRLLYEKQYTIAGAKKKLDERMRGGKNEAETKEKVLKAALSDALQELKSFRKLLT